MMGVLYFMSFGVVKNSYRLLRLLFLVESRKLEWTEALIIRQPAKCIGLGTMRKIACVGGANGVCRVTSSGVRSVLFDERLRATRTTRCSVCARLLLINGALACACVCLAWPTSCSDPGSGPVVECVRFESAGTRTRLKTVLVCFPVEHATRCLCVCDEGSGSCSTWCYPPFFPSLTPPLPPVHPVRSTFFPPSPFTFPPHSPPSLPPSPPHSPHPPHRPSPPSPSLVPATHGLDIALSRYERLQTSHLWHTVIRKGMPRPEDNQRQLDFSALGR